MSLVQKIRDFFSVDSDEITRRLQAQNQELARQNEQLVRILKSVESSYKRDVEELQQSDDTNYARLQELEVKLAHVEQRRSLLQAEYSGLTEQHSGLKKDYKLLELQSTKLREDNGVLTELVEELERRSLKYKGQLSALYARGYTLDRRDPRVIVDDGLSMKEKFEAVSLDYELSRAILFGGSQSGKRAGNNVLSRENWRKNTQAKIEDVSKMHLYDDHVKALVRSKALLSHGTTGLSLNRRIGEISLQPVQDLFYEEMSKTDSKILLPSQQ